MYREELALFSQVLGQTRYGNDDTTTNPNVQAAYGNGQYVYTENVWWAGGTR